MLLLLLLSLFVVPICHTELASQCIYPTSPTCLFGIQLRTGIIFLQLINSFLFLGSMNLERMVDLQQKNGLPN